MHLKPALSFVFDKSRNNYKVLPSLFSGIQMTRVVDVDGERQNTSPLLLLLLRLAWGWSIAGFLLLYADGLDSTCSVMREGAFCMKEILLSVLYIH